MHTAKRDASGLRTFLLESSLFFFSLSFLWQMNRHVQSAVLTLIHPDVPTSSAQTPYGQGMDAESLCAVMCVKKNPLSVGHMFVCRMCAPVAAVDRK